MARKQWELLHGGRDKSFPKLLGLKPITTPVTSPQSNGMAESFVKALKRDYAKLVNRADSKTVMTQLQGGSMTTTLTTHSELIRDSDKYGDLFTRAAQVTTTLSRKRGIHEHD